MVNSLFMLILSFSILYTWQSSEIMLPFGRIPSRFPSAFECLFFVVILLFYVLGPQTGVILKLQFRMSYYPRPTRLYPKLRGSASQIIWLIPDSRNYGKGQMPGLPPTYAI